MGKKRRGRPRLPRGKTRADYLEVRVGASEKAAFREASELAGLQLSAWVRERLRAAAREELGKAGRPVAFLSMPRKSENRPSGD
jgi:hypothetical protein